MLKSVQGESIGCEGVTDRESGGPGFLAQTPGRWKVPCLSWRAQPEKDRKWLPTLGLCWRLSLLSSDSFFPCFQRKPGPESIRISPLGAKPLSGITRIPAIASTPTGLRLCQDIFSVTDPLGQETTQKRPCWFPRASFRETSQFSLLSFT